MNLALIPFPFLVWALITDYGTRKIYNCTTYPLMGIGLLAQWYHHGVVGIAGGASAILLFMLLSSIYKAVRMGGGDLKLILGCLLFLDVSTSGLFIILVFVLSALLAMAQYAGLQGFSSLLGILKLDLMTAGNAPQEAVHVLGAQVILLAYGIVAFMA